MKHFKNKKLYTLVLVGLFIVAGGLLLTGCQSANEGNKENTTINESENKSDVSSVEDEKSEVAEETEEVKTLTGTVKEGLMSTIIVLGEDNNEYQFERDDEKIKTGESGIVIGNPITVEYKGELDPNADAQEVEVISMTIEDAK